MGRTVANIVSSCRGPRSKLRGRGRGRNMSLVRNSTSSTSSVPSFDLGIDLDDNSDKYLEVASQECAGLFSFGPVTKRARTGKRISIGDCVGVVSGVRCPSLISVRHCDTGTNLISYSNYGMQVVSDSEIVKEPVDRGSYLESDRVQACKTDREFAEFPTIDVVDNCTTSENMAPLVVSEITEEDAARVDLRESELSIIDEPMFESVLCDNDLVSNVNDPVSNVNDPAPDLGFDMFDEAVFDKAMRSSEKTGTTKSNLWVRNRFNHWRTACNFDTSVPLEEIPLKELSELLCKFFFCLKKKNGLHYPSQSVMQIYKGFNRILCSVQKDRIDSTGVNEEQFLMHAHPFFGRTNKSVILAMKKSIMAGANKARRKVDYFTEEDERRILAHPNNQATFPAGVQRRFVWYCTTIYLIRGNNELYNLRVVDFCLGTDERGREVLRYDETISKNHKPSLTKYQPEHFRQPVYSHDPDVIYTFKVLIAHMPKASISGHLFLSPIHHPKDIIWFKSHVNLGESSLRHFLRDMAAAIGLEGDYTNKSGRVTTITRMCVAKCPLKAIAANSGHQNAGSIERYNRITALEARAAQALARPGGGSKDFDKQFEVEVSEWHAANGSAQAGKTIEVSEIINGDHGEESRLDFRVTRFPNSRPVLAIKETGVPRLVSASCQAPSIPASDAPSIPASVAPSISATEGPFVTRVDPSRVGFTPRSTPIATPVATPIVTPTATPSSTATAMMRVTPSAAVALVDEEMRFWSQFNFEEEGDLGSVVPPKVSEAPSGTRFAMHRNLALLRRENSVLRDSLAKSTQQQEAFKRDLASYQLRLQSVIQQQQSFQNNQVASSNQNRAYPYPHFQMPQRTNGYRYPYRFQGSVNSQVPGTSQNVPFVQSPNNSFLQNPFIQAPFPASTQAPVCNLEPPFVNQQSQSQSLFRYPQVEPQVGYGSGNFMMPRSTGIPSSVAPVYGNIVYNYQALDVSQLLSHH